MPTHTLSCLHIYVLLYSLVIILYKMLHMSFMLLQSPHNYYPSGCLVVIKFMY